MKALNLIFFDTFSVTNGTKEIGLSYLKNSFSAADNLTFAITGGADKDLFSIDATTGVLTFNEQAFVNTALDFDRDGIYDVQITVSGSDPGDTQTANLGVEVAFDAVAPEISNLTFTHTVNDDGATVITITGTLTDDGSGMVDGSLGLTIKHELTGQSIYMPGGNVTLDEDGNFSLSQTMEANAPDGLWYISYLYIEDKAGNSKSISIDQSGNSLATATLPNGLYLGSTDKTAPEISNLTFTHTVNDDGATVITITGTLTDDGSGMVDGSLGLTIKHELTGQSIYMPGGNVTLDEDGNFSLSQTMEANAPDGLWYISYL
ncbi:cadherin repeat domain-containing protein, partial [Gammaproteobacteria bacterium]|nr:cadherin repeat domain-containing protein [Gammaproteobacteria bacterium]